MGNRNSASFKRRTLAQNKSPEYASENEEGEIPEQNLKRLPDNPPILLSPFLSRFNDARKLD